MQPGTVEHLEVYCPGRSASKAAPMPMGTSMAANMAANMAAANMATKGEPVDDNGNVTGVAVAA